MSEDLNTGHSAATIRQFAIEQRRMEAAAMVAGRQSLEEYRRLVPATNLKSVCAAIKESRRLEKTSLQNLRAMLEEQRRLFPAMSIQDACKAAKRLREDTERFKQLTRHIGRA